MPPARPKSERTRVNRGSRKDWRPFNVYLCPADHDFIKLAAALRKVSMTKIIEEALAAYQADHQAELTALLKKSGRRL